MMRPFFIAECRTTQITGLIHHTKSMKMQVVALVLVLGLIYCLHITWPPLDKVNIKKKNNEKCLRSNVLRHESCFQWPALVYLYFLIFL